MRKIKFRGKSVETGEWIYGSYLQPVDEKSKHFIIYFDQENKCHKEEVNQITLGQYTGYMDWNDTEIYEGDILKGDRYPISDNDSYVLLVEYENDRFWGVSTLKSNSRVSGISHGIADGLHDFEEIKLEIVGNIHDHAEMILE